MQISINKTAIQPTVQPDQASLTKRAAARLVALQVTQSLHVISHQTYLDEQAIINELEAILYDLEHDNITALIANLEKLAHSMYGLYHHYAASAGTHYAKQHFYAALQALLQKDGISQSPLYILLFGQGSYNAPDKGSLWYIITHGKKGGYTLTAHLEQLITHTAHGMMAPPYGENDPDWKKKIEAAFQKLLHAIQNRHKHRHKH